jgi:hypothetical protein
MNINQTALDDYIGHLSLNDDDKRKRLLRVVSETMLCVHENCKQHDVVDTEREHDEYLSDVEWALRWRLNFIGLDHRLPGEHPQFGDIINPVITDYDIVQRFIILTPVTTNPLRDVLGQFRKGGYKRLFFLVSKGALSGERLARVLRSEGWTTGMLAAAIEENFDHNNR